MSQGHVNSLARVKVNKAAILNKLNNFYKHYQETFLNKMYKNLKKEGKNVKETYLPTLIIEWVLGLRILEYPLGRERPFITFSFALVFWSFQYFVLIDWCFANLYNANVEISKTYFDATINKLMDTVHTSSITVFIVAGYLNTRVSCFFVNLYYFKIKNLLLFIFLESSKQLYSL